MRKLIDLEAAIEVIRFDSDRTPDDLDAKQATAYRNGIYTAINSISSCPVIEAAPVVHGRWHDAKFVRAYNGTNLPVVQCSKCECYFCDVINNHHFMYRYCPNCGAKMGV